jgi:AcrR family transcriptional regulator
VSEPVDTTALGSPDARASRTPVQKRGQTRVDTILEAAEQVFSEVGVEAGTTNAIAARAGSSVGSLYHFFPNKQAILEALAERYSESMHNVMRRERRIDEPWVPLEELFPRMISAFVSLDVRHPGYMAVCRATDLISGGKSAISLQSEAVMRELVRELILERNPGMLAAEAAIHAALSVVTVHAVLDHLGSHPEPERPAVIAGLVQMMVAYFSPIEARFPRPLATAVARLP